MEWLIRKAQSEDAEALVNILNPIIETGLYTVLDTPFTIEDERAFIENFPQRGILHVAVRPHDQKVVGFQSMEPFASYTHAFDHVAVLGTFIDLSQRRQGISSFLFDATFAVAKEMGYEKMFTFIRGDNPAALSVYQNRGFQIVGRAKKQAKINDKHVDEIIVECFL